MFDKAYKSYKQKCKELGVKPSLKKDIFSEEIERKKNENHQDIFELSRARKEKAPVLSETAKKANDIQTNKGNRKVKPKTKTVKKKVVKKTINVVSTKKIRVPLKTETKVEKPKRVLLTEEEKRLKRNAQSRKQYDAKKVKTPKVVLSDEEKQLRQLESRKKYYEKNKKKICDKHKAVRAANPKRVFLTDEQRRAKRKKYYDDNREQILAKTKARTAAKPKRARKPTLSEDEKKAIRKEKARLYHLEMKDDPVYQEKRKASSKTWTKNNREKVAASNKKYRDEVRTPEQLEEKRRKQREYRRDNVEHMRQKDRDRKQQRKDFIKNNPEAHEKKKARERERYARNKADPVELEKMREKERNRAKRKR